MTQFTPARHSGEVAAYVIGFVKEQKGEMWRIFRPLIPFVVLFLLFDVLSRGLFDQDTENSFAIGAFFSTYFFSCLAVSWHRVVIQGPDNYTPMNPFKPKKNELVFVAMGFLIAATTYIMDYIPEFIKTAASENILLYGVLLFFTVLVLIYLPYRVMFYFPVKAVDADVTFRKAYKMSKGFFWSFIFAGVFSYFKIFVVMILYMVFLAFVLLSGFQSSGGVVGLTFFAASYVFALPVLLYFLPIFTIIGVTLVSNFYLYALQNPKDN